MKFFEIDQMKLTFLFPPVLLLAACATPEERCVRAAWEDYNRTKSRISVAQRNVDRGYAVHEQTREHSYIDICYDSEKKPYKCEQVRYETIETPVAIDVRQERRKIAEYEAQLAKQRVRAKERERQCLAQI